MHLTAPSRLAILTTLALTTTAAPHPGSSANPPSLNNLFQRTCSVQYPDLRTTTAPDQPIPYTLAITSQTQQIEVGFTIPDDAVGPCSLMVSLPENCGMSGSAQVNVYALDGPAAGALVGTTVFAEGTSATINSFACRGQMCYGLEVAGGADGSGVEFVEMEGVGLSMIYGC